MSYVYLASPYSDLSPRVREERFYAAMRATAWLLMQRIWVYSPIVHCHELAIRCSLRFDAEYWQEYNEAMLISANKLFVLGIDGWDKSKGVTGERAFAGLKNIPAQLIEPVEDISAYKIRDMKL